ncbi:MAG: C40 family peptidase [Xenococcaceae cyanobacterium]
MLDRQVVIEEARSWLRTPWKHQQKIKQCGVDCINFISACGEKAGITIEYPITYERKPFSNSLYRLLSRFFKLTTTPQPADIVVFQYGGLPAHVGVMLDDCTFIHAYCASSPSPHNKSEVRTDSLSNLKWRSRLYCFFDLDSYGLVA